MCHSYGNSPSFMVNLSVAFGYLGLSLMVLQMILISRIDAVAGIFGLDALQQFHKKIGILAFFVVLAHPALLLFSKFYDPLCFLPVSRSPWSIWIGTFSFVAVLLVIVSSIWRKQLKISFELWQIIHGPLVVLALVLAGVHIRGLGRYEGFPAVQGVLLAYFLIFIGFVIRYHVIRPIQDWKKPWVVVENKPEKGNARTLRLRPEGHNGFTFKPGQFAWICLGRTPFFKEQHPLSFSSDGDVTTGDGEIAFTIKDLGDWSGTVVPRVKPGDRVFVDGPYGVFSVDHERGPGIVLITGGIGITPLYSTLVTLAARKDPRPVVLFYGTNTIEELTFDEELLKLTQKMALAVVFVLYRPPAGWTGETGFITAEVFHRHLPADYRSFQYFICGPVPLMESMENILPGLGIPADNIHISERFDMV